MPPKSNLGVMYAGVHHYWEWCGQPKVSGVWGGGGSIARVCGPGGAGGSAGMGSVDLLNGGCLILCV